ncbi:kinase-like domain-containing protein [Rhizophagus irregularis DAOM 181602=DAOM 197198]|nr:kinase-like domain-containing protein [Rhizophagus irregularis DAOM 181602=DAOM 197198]
MDTSKQNSDTTKTDVKNLWKECDGEYQLHATIFSTDSTTESDETGSILKRVNIMDLEKRKEAYGVCGECNEPGTGLYCNDFFNEIKYYISEPVNSTDYLSSVQETISSSSANPISECLDCELDELDLKQDDDE